MTVAEANGGYNIQGDFTFERASEIFRSINVSNLSQDKVTINLSNIDQSDSAALAVMLEWVNQATKSKKQINFSHVPDQLMRLIKMTDLQNILKLVPNSDHT